MATIAIGNDMINQGDRATKAPSNFCDNLKKLLFKNIVNVCLSSIVRVNFEEIKVGVSQKITGFVERSKFGQNIAEDFKELVKLFSFCESWMSIGAVDRSDNNAMARAEFNLDKLCFDNTIKKYR